jgi:hypothetical protein
MCWLGASGATFTVTYNGTGTSTALTQALTGAYGGIGIYYLPIVGAQSGDIVVTASGGVAMALQAVNVMGLASNVLDVHTSAAGGASQPDSGTTTPTVTACEYAFALAMSTNLSALPAGSWLNSFSSTGQDNFNISGAIRFRLSGGYRFLSATGTVDAAMTGLVTSGGQPPTHWAAGVATFK